jgi:hypothetical protein
LALSGLLQTGAAGQSASATADGPIRFEQVIASVVDSRGNALPNLRAREFVVKENGKPTTVVGFNPGSDAPLSLIIIIDTNGQMGPLLGSAKGAVQPLLALLGPRDEYAIYSFDTDLKAIQAFSPIRRVDVEKVKADIGSTAHP